MAAPIPLVPPTTSAERPANSPRELTVDTSLSGPMLAGPLVWRPRRLPVWPWWPWCATPMQIWSGARPQLDTGFPALLRSMTRPVRWRA